ncbi:MAG: DUF2505 domain-containing protein [Pauljensenia sp.]
MHIKDSYTYPATLARIGEMFADPEYTRSRVDVRGVVDPKVRVTEEEGTTTIAVDAAIDTSVLPSAARRFVRSGLTISIVETWAPTQGTTRRGTTEVKVKGAPVTLRAVSVLTGEAGTTTRSVDAELSVSIPLVGRRVEQEAAGSVHSLFAKELEAARTWLEAHPEH